MSNASTWEASRSAERRARIGSAELRWIDLRELARRDQHDAELLESVSRYHRTSYSSVGTRRGELCKLGLVEPVGRRAGRTVHQATRRGLDMLRNGSPTVLNDAWHDWRREHDGKLVRCAQLLEDLVDAVDSPGGMLDDRLSPALEAARAALS